MQANEEVYYIRQKSENEDIIKLQICGITYPDNNYSIFRSRSNVNCIEYVEEGTGTVNVGDVTFNPGEGDSYFLHSGMLHNYYSDKEKPWKKYFVNISGDLMESLVEGYKLSDAYYFPNLDIKKELCAIIEFAKQPEHDYTAEIIEIINRIFLKMHSCIKNERDVGIAAKMKDYLNTQIMEKFKMEELCKFVSRSESQTIRIFKQAYGITPYNYVLEKKISLAKRFLRNTNLSVKQIADKLSFADEYYFSNFFKQKVGKSPTKYRKSE